MKTYTKTETWYRIPIKEILDRFEIPRSKRMFFKVLTEMTDANKSVLEVTVVEEEYTAP